jgi:anti-sigma factor ChrR (cupin superfamily)
MLSAPFLSHHTLLAFFAFPNQVKYLLLPSVTPSMDNLNADLSQRVAIYTPDEAWSSSPAKGVWRKFLERAGRESGRATSLVRYNPGAAFPAHSHPGGEEILVLEGVFSDETGDYSAGSYLLNPPDTCHSSFSKEGCTLFVKLHQYSGTGRPRVVLDTHGMEWLPGLVAGLSVKPLYSQPGYPESMALVYWEPHTRFHRHTHPGGEEILVLQGVFEDEHGSYPEGTWLRNPDNSVHTPYSTEGCLIYVKVGGLT